MLEGKKGHCLFAIVVVAVSVAIVVVAVMVAVVVAVVVVEHVAWVVAHAESRVEDQMSRTISDVDDAWGRVALNVSGGIMRIRVKVVASVNVVVVAWITDLKEEEEELKYNFT